MTELAVNGKLSRTCSKNRGLERRNSTGFRNESGIRWEIMYIHTHTHTHTQNLRVKYQRFRH